MPGAKDDRSGVYLSLSSNRISEKVEDPHAFTDSGHGSDFPFDRDTQAKLAVDIASDPRNYPGGRFPTTPTGEDESIRLYGDAYGYRMRVDVGIDSDKKAFVITWRGA